VGGGGLCRAPTRGGDTESEFSFGRNSDMSPRRSRPSSTVRSTSDPRRGEGTPTPCPPPGSYAPPHTPATPLPTRERAKCAMCASVCACTPSQLWPKSWLTTQYNTNGSTNNISGCESWLLTYCTVPYMYSSHGSTNNIRACESWLTMYCAVPIHV
jgi:hypothetical protein